jgi:pimeloyl-ACP methyl ester carboxylesterase
MSSDSQNNIEPADKTYTSQGLKLHYLDWGNGEKPPLILVHGTMDHARSWDWVARGLCLDWHVIAPDLRGHGDSDWSPDGAYLSAYYLQDLADLIDTLGFESVSIVAHSFGGNSAARYSAIYPDRVKHLVLVDAMGPNQSVLDRWQQHGAVARAREWMEKRQNAAKHPRYFDSIEFAASRLLESNPLLTAEQAQHLASHGVRRFDQGYAWKYDPLTGNFSPEDFAIHLAEYWQEITAPTLMCWGPRGWTTDPAIDGSSAFFKHPEHLTFKESGHWVHHNQTEAFVAAVQAFLQKPAP